MIASDLQSIFEFMSSNFQKFKNSGSHITTTICQQFLTQVFEKQEQ